MQFINVGLYMVPVDVLRTLSLREKLSILEAMFDDGPEPDSTGELIQHTHMMLRNNQPVPFEMNDNHRPEHDVEPEENFDDSIPPTVRLPFFEPNFDDFVPPKIRRLRLEANEDEGSTRT